MDNLFLLLLLPLVSAVLLALIRTPSIAKWIGLLASLLTLGLTIPFICQFDTNQGIQYQGSWEWISGLNIGLNLGLDGINIPFVLLTNGLMPLIILSSFGKSMTGAFYALISFMQVGLLLVFLSFDAFAFYVGWEIALIPIYFICALWGSGDRIRINIKFFVYTFLGSIFMLVALIYLYQQTPNNDFAWTSIANLDLSQSSQSWVFLAFFIAFAIKIPILPFHTWQPDTYTHAPATGTMLLSGIMLKMGVFGLIRWLLPVTPYSVSTYGPIVLILCVTGVVYASIIAFKQNDAKRLIAYSSIAHVGLISAGIFSLTLQGIQGALLQIINHGISVVGLFFIIDIIESRTGTRDLKQLGGLASKMQCLAIVFLVITMGAIGLPLTNGFIGEFLLLWGLYGVPTYGVWYTLFGGLTLILGAVYMLRFYQKTMLGNLSSEFALLKDIHGYEMLVLGIIVLLIIGIGVMPNSLLNISEGSINQLIKTVNN